MADYWKSTGKRYCDFCKCWMADNKASIDFHERGKNHQANVKRRLGEIKKNSIEKRKKDEASKKMFAQMEKAALAAVQKDISSANGAVGKSDLKNIVAAHSADTNSDRSSTYPWRAMTGPQGFAYYYNSLTGESTWTMPEVFKKLKEKQKKEEGVTAKVERVKEKKSTHKANTEKKEKKVVLEKEEIYNIHPLLGGWSTVKNIDVSEEQDAKEQKRYVEGSQNETAISQQTNDEDNTNDEQERNVGKKFKERVMKTNITSSEEQVSFKKRKTKTRNVRKREDDD